MGKTRHDWLSIKAEYMYASPAISQVDLSRKHGINPVTMCRKAKRERWDEGRNEYVSKVQMLSHEKVAQGIAGHAVSVYVECQTTLEAVLDEIRNRLKAGAYSNYDLVKTARALALQLETMDEKETKDPHSWATIRWMVLKRDKFRCHYCGRSAAEDGVKLHVDHVIPRALGGTNDLDNLVAACETCNEAKCDELLESDCRG